ncbi:hypothetical protein GBA52_023007 [Prunus armeniaca]|nr:hypothetical protein GBA52_023007 [Prunus armeniaca]
MAPFLAPNLITIIMITIITTSPQLVLTHPNLIPPHLSQLDTWIVHNIRDYANRKATQATLRFDSKLLSAETVYYGEYKCMGPGSSSTGRVKYAKTLSDEEAKPFLSMTFIRGSKWVLPPPKL